jgi:hypothetical protein
MNQPQLPQVHGPTPFHVHGHSTRIGVKLGVIACGYAMPTDQAVDEILRVKTPPHITVDEFALETLTLASNARMDRRRSIAISILVPMIQRSMGDGPLKKEDMEKLVELAWSGARTFEEQDMATASIDSLTAPSSTPGG